MLLRDTCDPCGTKLEPLFSGFKAVDRYFSNIVYWLSVLYCDLADASPYR